MDKLEHFLKKNHHRVVHYFTNTGDVLAYVMVLSIYEGVLYMVDLSDGHIPYVETGGFQKRFYVGSRCASTAIPEPIHEQPTDGMMRDEKLWKGALQVLRRKQAEGSVVVLGSNYMIDARPDGSFFVSELVDFPDTLEQQGIFQKYDLDYFYNHKHTIPQNVRIVYDRFHTHFLENLEAVKNKWEGFSKDTRHLSGLEDLLAQYDDRNKQCLELRNLVLGMYQIWKQLSSEYDAMDIQADPVSFDQNLRMNQKKQLLYRKLDKIKLIEKHATDLLLKIHIARTCLLFCIHLIVCGMGDIQFRVDDMLETQSKVRKQVLRSPSVMIFQE